VEKDGQTFFPARAAGIAVGDLILAINGSKITSESQLQDLVDKYGKQGKDIRLLVKHGDKNKLTKVNPVLCDKTGRYRIGLFIKNSTAGVGTLTFYEPQSKTYGALGHMIADFESGHKLNPVDGKIVGATVKGLQPGKKGAPGEKLGVFKGKSDIIGNIEKNTNCGIFGRLQKGIHNPYYSQPIPVAMKYQIQEAPAEIFTVLDDEKMERFNIEIVDILPADNQGKGLVIKVTDKELLERTGGIIQGMSGSPIIQNGRLVGAVTHVFINDPAKGYGVLAENMLKEANLLNVKHMEKIAG
jgi:stage IV sporulation protein B